MTPEKRFKLSELGSGELLSRAQMKVVLGGLQTTGYMECNCYLNDPSEENWFTCADGDSALQCCGMAGMSMNCAEAS